MNRTLILFLAAPLLAAGCQNPAWQNPYAMIGPATVPPPAAGTATAAPTVDLSHSKAAPAASGTIRSEIALTPSPAGASGEEPIRIVEATPASKPAATRLGPSAPITEPPPPTVVAATPTSRISRSGTTAPAIKFNPSSAPAQMSQLPRPPATAPAGTSPGLNRTRGYIPAQPQSQPAPAAPRNRLSSTATDRDAGVVPATFVETTTAASGQWKSR